MTTGVFIIVILAAVLHASWNALVKKGTSKEVAIIAMVLGHIPFALLAIMFAPMPEIKSWGFIIASAILHTGYQLFLMMSYRIGDLSHVYPIARGVAPMFVLVASVAFFGAGVSWGQGMGALIIALGIISIGWSHLRTGGAATWYALATGAFIAAYSLNDGLGVRVSGTVLGFYGWSAMLNMVLMATIAARIYPDALKSAITENWRIGLLSGGASFAAYALVMWAFTMAPIAVVTALRETSIIFAMIIGALFLGERLTPRKIIAVIIVLVGVIVLRIG